MPPFSAPPIRVAHLLVVVPAFTIAVIAGLGEFAKLQGWRLRARLQRLSR